MSSCANTDFENNKDFSKYQFSDFYYGTDAGLLFHCGRKIT